MAGPATPLIIGAGVAARQWAKKKVKEKIAAEATKKAAARAGEQYAKKLPGRDAGALGREIREGAAALNRDVKAMPAGPSGKKLAARVGGVVGVGAASSRAKTAAEHESATASRERTRRQRDR